MAKRRRKSKRNRRLFRAAGLGVALVSLGLLAAGAVGFGLSQYLKQPQQLWTTQQDLVAVGGVLIPQGTELNMLGKKNNGYRLHLEISVDDNAAGLFERRKLGRQVNLHARPVRITKAAVPDKSTKRPSNLFAPASGAGPHVPAPRLEPIGKAP